MRLSLLLMRLSVLLVLAQGRSALAQSPDRQLTAERLRVHCKACHGVGSLRFIRSDSDAEMFDYLATNRSPATGKIWAEVIIEVLNWRSDAPPPFNELMVPPNRDWMPKGSKRLDFAADVVNGVPVRRTILATLQELLVKPTVSSKEMPRPAISQGKLKGFRSNH